MTIERASDNPFPSILIEEATEPAAPDAGHQRLYIDSTTHHLKRTNSSGTDTDIEAGSAGSVATDAIWDAAGDLAQGTGANTAAKLTAGTSGMFLKSAGAAAANLWAFPPGYQIDYVEFTSPVAITQTAEASATTIVTATATAFDGSTGVMIECYMPAVRPPTNVGAADNVSLWLFDGSSSIGRIYFANVETAAASASHSVRCARILTPSNATHTYSIRGTVSSVGNNGSAIAGAGGSGNNMPGYIRITKV